MSIMDNDWTKSSEYQELLGLMMSAGEEGRDDLLATIRDDVRDTKGQEEAKDKVGEVLARLHKDIERRGREEFDNKYLSMCDLVERLSGIDF
jgi:hypothetical protein